MEELENMCRHLFSFMYIPVYLYHDKELIKCFPKEAEDYPPPAECLKKIMQSNVSCVISKHGVLFGGIQAKDGFCVVLGHMSPVPLSTATLEKICGESGFAQSQAESFVFFCRNIKNMDSAAFLNLITFVFYVVNKEDMEMYNVLQFDEEAVDNMMKTSYTSTVFQLKEEESFRSSLAFEKEFLRCIENGDLEKLDSISERSFSASVGRFADDNLRQQKNMFIVCVTLVCRVAIRGGFAESMAFALSEMYMQRMERLNDLQEVMNLTTHMIRDYCSRVAETKQTSVSDDLIKRVIDYVHKNTNRDLKVEEIAAHFRVDRSQLSHKFIKELGFGLSKFIQRCKLDESKNLLQYTDKSISEISCYLGFANQSHFQRVFKGEMGVTPKEFRMMKK